MTSVWLLKTAIQLHECSFVAPIEVPECSFTSPRAAQHSTQFSHSDNTERTQTDRQAERKTDGQMNRRSRQSPYEMHLLKMRTLSVSHRKVCKSVSVCLKLQEH